MDFENMTQRPSFSMRIFMSENNFCTLFGLVEQYLVPKRDTRPDVIPIKAKLAIVLKFLASGDLQLHVSSAYRISKQHFGVVIVKVCEALCIALSNEFPQWNAKNMLHWAKGFEEEWNFPNCFGRSTPSPSLSHYRSSCFHPCQRFRYRVEPECRGRTSLTRRTFCGKV